MKRSRSIARRVYALPAPRPSSSRHARSAAHCSYWSAVQPRSPTSSCHVFGWLIVQRMSAARSTSSASAFFAARLSTIVRWFSWYCCLDPRPELGELGIAGGGAGADHLADGARRAPCRARELRALSRSWRTGSGSSSVSRYHACSATGTSPSSPRSVTFQSVAQDAALRLEGEVDGLERDAGLGRDRRHRRRRVALLLEQPPGRLEDLAPRRRRLLAAARRVVRALGVDSLGHFATLAITSIHERCIQYRRCAMEAASIIEKPDGRAGTDELRAQLRQMWGSVAGGWAEHAEFVESRGARVTATLLELAAPGPGERVLELACGAGGVGLAAAPLVGPDGEVVISDVAPEMTAIARARAEALGLANVRVRELDLEQIDEPDESYDVVLCREGLMLVPDPARAAREIAAGPAAGRPRRARRLGPARAEPVARRRVRRRQRPARHADAAARASRARSRSTTTAGSPRCSRTPASPTSRWRRSARRTAPRRRRSGGRGRRRSPARWPSGWRRSPSRPARLFRPRARGDRRVRDADGLEIPGVSLIARATRA